MKKDTFYFPHDFGARKDPKLIKLFIKHKHEGIGLYWMLIEMMYEQGGYLMLSDMESYAFELRIGCDRIADLIDSYELFEKDDEKFWSNAVLRRLSDREKKRDDARKNANIRWSKVSEKQTDNATALPADCQPNAIKERKGKEIKGNKRKVKEKKDTLFDGENVKKPKISFEDYQTYITSEFEKLKNDPDFIRKEQEFYPGVDIKKSIESALIYWTSKEAYQKYAKKTTGDNMKSLVHNSIKFNKTYPDRNAPVKYGNHEPKDYGTINFD